MREREAGEVRLFADDVAQRPCIAAKTIVTAIANFHNGIVFFLTVSNVFWTGVPWRTWRKFAWRDEERRRWRWEMTENCAMRDVLWWWWEEIWRIKALFHAPCGRLGHAFGYHCESEWTGVSVLKHIYFTYNGKTWHFVTRCWTRIKTIYTSSLKCFNDSLSLLKSRSLPTNGNNSNLVECQTQEEYVKDETKNLKRELLRAQEEVGKDSR